MIHLRLRTEFSFRRAYGQIPSVIEVAGGDSIGIADNGTFGHVSFFEAAKKANKKPILGVEIAVVHKPEERERQYGPYMAFLAKNEDGLKEIYQLVTLSNTEYFYYYPRIGYEDVNNLSDNIIILSGSGPDMNELWPTENVYLEYNPVNKVWNRSIQKHLDSGMFGGSIVTCDNFYPTLQDKAAYEIIVGRNTRSRTGIQHIADEWDLRSEIPEAPDEAFENTHVIADMCNCNLPKAKMVIPPKKKTLRQLCIEGAKERGIDINKDPYKSRMDRELAMIDEKGFEDYFYVISDLVKYAKQHMLVGPARGSSAGSLVCMLLDITDVDPIKHGLMFERFIDTTRKDLPDIDIDFQDTKRDMIFQYLGEMYGEDHIGRIGTVNRFKAKSTIVEVAAALNVPSWEVKDVKDAIIERSTGDARAAFCILDTFDTLDIGKALIEKYPQMKIAAQIENHAKHSSMHAAGILLTSEPLTNFCAINNKGSAQIDKEDAEKLNMLKIDALGLRTLTVIQDTLDQIGETRQFLLDYPLDDTEAFNIINDEKYSGIFQFEGYALQVLSRQMPVESFNDIVAITTLARPGPLHSGGATEFVQRRTGRKKVEHLHELAEDFTNDSFGTVIYQEQVMMIGRIIGKLSWEDVSSLRKAMSKSLGEEFFNRYWEKFKIGAEENNIKESEARHIWEHMCTFGSWAFNKSHAVSYGLLSYWCMVLKAHFPLEFAASCLRSVKDDDQGVKILRDLVEEGFEYVPVDTNHSDLNWKVVDGKLIGGLTNIKGIGEKKAIDIIERRNSGRAFTPGIVKLLMNPVTPYDDIFEAQRRFGDIYDNPEKHNILSGGVSRVKNIYDPGEYVFIAKLRERNLRDLNEYGNLVKRGGRVIKRNNLFLNLVLEDDTGSIIAKIDRFVFPHIGKPLIETAKLGDYFIWKGRIRNDGWRMVFVSKWRKLD